MRKLSLIIIALFVVAFVAGAMSVLSLRPQESSNPRHGSWMARELNLTEQQREAMEKIWADVGRGEGWREDGERRKAYQKQRDDAIRQLVPEDKHDALQESLDTYSRQMTELGNQRRAAFDAAAEKTRAILTDAQKKKYDEVRARWREGRSGMGWGRTGAGAGTAPATQPSGVKE